MLVGAVSPIADVGVAKHLTHVFFSVHPSAWSYDPRFGSWDEIRNINNSMAFDCISVDLGVGPILPAMENPIKELLLRRFAAMLASFDALPKNMVSFS